MWIRRYLKISIEILSFVFRYPEMTFRTLLESAQNFKIVKSEQARLLVEDFSNHEKRLIVFLVRPRDEIGGGVMSICSIAAESKKYEAIHDSKVIVASFPKKGGRFLRYSKFQYDDVIFQFEEALEYFSKLEKIQIHIPEFMVASFTRALSKKDFSLEKIPEVKFNILNQNVVLMPKPKVVRMLKKFGPVTCTTAHSRYCTREESNKYGVPYHHLSAIFSTKFYKRSYYEKENVLVVSPDHHPMREKILKKIRDAFPELKIKVIQNMPYEEFKQWVSRAKWSLTFGEGMDGYYVEPLLSGGIPFAVYNSTFFPDKKYAEMSSNFGSYDEMMDQIVGQMNDLDNEEKYLQLHTKQMELYNQVYPWDDYFTRIREFYEERFSFPDRTV